MRTLAAKTVFPYCLEVERKFAMCAMAPGRPIEGVPHTLGRYRLLHQKLGSGNYASVVAAVHVDLEVQVAVKIIDTSKVRDQYVLRHLAREAALLRRLAHPNVVAVFESLRAGPLYCLVTELVNGGELCAHVSGQPDGHLDEATTRRFAGQLLSALAHMHNRGVVHRDLKMKNILLNEDRDLVKIIDFGLSNAWSPESPLLTHCGSPGYAAPEVYVQGKPYGPEVDMWSLGVVLYGMAVGSLPFPTCRDKTVSSAERRSRLIAQINRGITQDHVNAMTHFSASFTDLVSRLLTPEPPARLTIHNALLHPWLETYESPPASLYQLSTRERTLIVAKVAVTLKISVEAVEQQCRANRLGEVAAVCNILAHQQLRKYYMAWKSQQSSRIKSKRVCSGEQRTLCSKLVTHSEIDSYQEWESNSQENLKQRFSQLTLEPETTTEDLATISTNLPGFTIMKSSRQSVAPYSPISKPVTKIFTSMPPSRGSNSVSISQDNAVQTTGQNYPKSRKSGAVTSGAGIKKRVHHYTQTTSHDLTVSHTIFNSSDLEDVQQRGVSGSNTAENVQYFDSSESITQVELLGSELEDYIETDTESTPVTTQGLINKGKPLLFSKQKSGIYQGAHDRFTPADDEPTLTRSSVGKENCKEVTSSKTQSRVEIFQKLKLITGKNQLRSLLKSACPSQHTACSKEVKEVTKNKQSCNKNEVNKVRQNTLSSKTGPVSRYMMDVALEESLGRTKYMTLRPWRIWAQDKNKSARLPKYRTDSLKKSMSGMKPTYEHKKAPRTCSPKTISMSQKTGSLK